MVVMANQSRKRRQPTASRFPAQFLPRPTARWLPDPEFWDRIRRRAKLHNAAEEKLAATTWGRELLPFLRRAWADFWEFAIDYAHGKMQAGEAKRVLRQKGRLFRLFTLYRLDPKKFEAACDSLADILASLRRRGHPPKAEFHDLVAFAHALARAIQREERAVGLELLRRYLEFPELGYALRPHDISRIAYKVSRKVVSGAEPEVYPYTALLWSHVPQRQKRGF